MDHIVDSHLVPQEEPIQPPAKKKRQRDWRETARAKRETPRAYSVYLQYRNMGQTRSLTGLVEYYREKAKAMPPDAPPEDRYSPDMTTIKKWCYSFNWYGRVKEYDDEQSRLLELRRQEQLLKMDQEHALLGRSQLLAVVGLIDTRIRSGELSDTAAVAYAKFAAQLQRIALGGATSRSEETRTTFNINAQAPLSIDPRQMTDAELEELRLLALELKRREELGEPQQP